MPVLIVDDDPCILEAMRMLIESRGYNTLTATSAVDAIKLLDQHCPDLILTDINMPEYGGYALLNRVQQAALEKQIPVVFVSAMSRPKDVEEGLKAGARDYIPKPFTPDRLLDCVDRFACQSLSSPAQLQKF